MAGAGYKLFNTGDVLTAAQVNTYLNEQTVMVFASSAARTSALSGVLAEGMVSYLQDTNAVEVYNGTAWVGVSGAGDVTEVQAGTGISVASGTGPIPVVTNTMATAIDAEGDLIIGDAADAFQRLAIGSNTHVLTVDTSVDGKIKWAAPAGSSGPTFQAQRASDQSISAATWTKVQLATENWDSDSCYDPTTNYRFTPNKAGYYQVNMNIRFGVDSGGGQITAANIYKNGASDLIYGWCLNTNGTSTSMIDGSGQIYFNGSSDYIELYAFNNTGTTRNLNASTFMDAVWIRS
jgi:hypothetical protein